MSEFNETKDIKKSRKDHQCCQCHQTIPKGSSYTIFKGVFDGDFFENKYHAECWELWNRLNRGDDGYDDDYWLDINEFYSNKEMEKLRENINKQYNTLYYVGYREIFERPGRDGYTSDIKKAGKFTIHEAKSMTKYDSCGGKPRWFIPCSALDSFKDGKLHSTEMY